MQVESQVHREETVRVVRIGGRQGEGKRRLEEMQAQQLVVRRRLEQRVVSVNVC
jgi:hypothetical protein